MFNLLIVDDDEEIRQGLIQKIDWNKYGFNIIGGAQNGREAIDIIENVLPDLIITDISMPIMNGLELAEYVHSTHPTVKTVIVTGYDDFRFAQQAIKYGVEDYVLKPVLPKDIEELINKIKRKLEHDFIQKENLVKLKEHFNESLPIIREKFLSLIIEGHVNEKELDRKLNTIKLSLNGNAYIIAAGEFGLVSKEDSIFGEEDTELMRFAVLNIAKEIIEKHTIGETLFHDNEMIIIFSFNILENNDNHNSIILKRIYLILDEIRQSVEKYLKIKISFGVGSITNSLLRLKESYKAALSALEYKLIVGESGIIFIYDLEPMRKNTVYYDEQIEQKLISAIKFGTEKSIDESINNICNIFIGSNVPFHEYQLYFIELAAALSKLCRDFEIDTLDVLGVQNIYIDVLKLKSLNEIKEWIRELSIKIMSFIYSSRQKSTQTLLKKAQDYVQANFCDENLSIQKVADYLHISQSYLSIIFKKETGDTFLKYLVKVRMNAAIEFLNSSYKLAEVAERIGYPDMSYFSYFFKKNYGMSPREYRNKLVETKE